MTVKFWLLDPYYTTENGRTDMRLWGIDGKGKVQEIVDDSLYPFFLSTRRLDVPNSVSIVKVKKKFEGQLKKMYQIEMETPGEVGDFVKSYEGAPDASEIYEGDIFFSERYTYSRGLNVSGWNKMEDGQPIGPLDGNVPDLSLMALDIEVYNSSHDKINYVNPERKGDRVNVVGYQTDEMSKPKALRLDDFRGEEDMLVEVRELFKRHDPDIVFTYSKFDLAYLVDRSEFLGLKMFLGRDDSVPHESQYDSWAVNGRCHVDLHSFVDSVIGQKLGPRSLKNIAVKYLKAPPDEVMDITSVEKEERKNWEWEYWDDRKKREWFVNEYNASDVRWTLELGKSALPFTIALSNMICVPIDQVHELYVGDKIDHYIMRIATEENEAIPLRSTHEHEEFKGAHVESPVPGLLHDVAVIDFKSMYPHNIIQLYPDSLMAKGCGRLFKLRDQYPKSDPRSKPINLSLKVMLAAFYGYLSSRGKTRWFDQDMAAGVTRLGRKKIKQSIEIARKSGYRVVYGDTDSVFVQGRNPERLAHRISEKFGVPVEYEGTFSKLFFAQAAGEERGRKKSYFALPEDGGEMVVKGFEAVKHDWCGIAQKAQKKVAETVMETENPKLGAKLASVMIARARQFRFPKSAYVISKNAWKVGEYKVKTPQGVLAERYEMDAGSQVDYVVLNNGGQSVFEKAELAEKVKDLHKLDTEWYVYSQILPAVMRVLGFFGITEEEVVSGMRNIKLGEA